MDGLENMWTEVCTLEKTSLGLDAFLNHVHLACFRKNGVWKKKLNCFYLLIYFYILVEHLVGVDVMS